MVVFDEDKSWMDNLKKLLDAVTEMRGAKIENGCAAEQFSNVEKTRQQLPLRQMRRISYRA